MSGPDTITIQVDVSGALTNIQGTDAALKALGVTAQSVAQQIQAMAAASGGIDACTQAARDSAAGLAELKAGVETLNSRLAALDGGESVFASILSQASDVVGILADLEDALKTVGKSVGALGGISATMQATTAATTTATAATRALAVAQTALPLLAIAAAVASLGVGLYELVKGSQESASAFKDMDSAFAALTPVLGQAGQGMAEFAARVDQASASRRKLMELSLAEELKAGQAELRTQADIVKQLFEEVYGVAAVRGRGSKGEKLVDDAGLAAYREFLKSGDLEALATQLSAAGGKAHELFNAVVEVDGKPRGLIELASASVDTHDKLDLVGQQMRIVRGETVAAVQPQKVQTQAMRDAAEAAANLAACQAQLAQQNIAVTRTAGEAAKADFVPLDAATLSDSVAESLTALNEATAASIADFENKGMEAFNDNLAKEAERARQEKQDAAEKAGKAQAEEVKKQADTIAGGWADAMFSQITGKGEGIRGWFKSLFKQIATDALKNKIALPVITGVLGGAAGLLGGAAGAAGPAGTAPLQGQGDILSGLSGILDGFEDGVNKLGAKLFGTAGTDGWLGSGGTFLGSADLATGLTGGLAGIGLGSTAAGLLGALGIGKGNAKGGAIGGAIGGIAGSFIPGLGTALGGLLGGAIGSLFGGKPSNKEGSAVIDLDSGNVSIGGFTGSKFSQENRDQAGAIATQVLTIKDSLEKAFGASIKGTLAVGAGDRDGLFATGLNTTARTSFSDDEAGSKKLLAFVTEQFVNGIRDQLAPEIAAALGRVDYSSPEKASADLGFIRDFRDSIDSMTQGYGLQNQAATAARAEVLAQTEAVQKFHDTTARLFPDALAEADAALRKYVEGLVGIAEATPPMTRFETAMVALRAQFEAYKPLLEEVGYTAEEAQTAIATGLAKAQGKLREDFEGAQTRALNEATGKGYLNQVGDLKTSLDEGRRDAVALGADPAIVDRTVNAQLAQMLGDGNLGREQLQEIITSFGTEFPEAAAAAQTAMDNLVTAADEITKLNQSFADRIFAATNDTGTEAGALADFDRKANAERLEIAQKAGVDLVAYDEAVAAERARVQKDFADRLAASNQSIQDRLFAAQTDTASLNGALAAFDRKTAQERAEIAKLAGADLVGFDQATALERLRIEKEFADRQAEITRGLEDRAFALSVAGDGDAQIKLLERQQIAEFKAAQAAGYTAEQLTMLAEVLAGEMTQAVEAALARTDELNQSIQDRLFAATTDTSTLAGSLAAFDRKVGQERVEIARTAGADLVSFDQATKAERLKIEEEFARRQVEISRGLEDRAFALSVAGRSDGEILLLERRQKAEFEAARAAGYTQEQLTQLAQVLAGEMTQAVQAVRDQIDALNLSIQDRLFAARTDTSTLAGALAAFDRQSAQERKEIAKTTGADLVSFDQAVALERQAILKQFAEQAAAVDRSFADRLFAATNDASTLQGALAAFDRQAARDRADAAKTAGVDMLGVEKALAAERAAIVKQFADQTIERAQAAADQAKDKLVDALNREAEAARNLADGWKQAGQGIRDALKADQMSDAYSSLNPEDRARLAEAELRRLSDRARDASLTAQERLEAAQALPEARRAFLDAVRPLYEGTERWGEALDLSASLLDGVALATDREVDLATRQVDLAEGQLQALGIVNDSVLTVAEALEQYQQAIADLAAAKATPVAAPPAAQVPAVPAGEPANSNQPAIGQTQIALKQGAAFGNEGGVLNPLTGGYQYALDMRDARGGGQVDFFPSAEAAIAAAERLGLGLDKVVRRYQTGGIVGNGLYGVDSVLARYEDGGFIALAGGEFVTRAPSVTAETTPILRAINDTGRVPASLKDKAALGTQRMEALLEGLLSQSASAERRQADLDARGYEAMIAQLEALLNQGRDSAADRRRTAR